MAEEKVYEPETIPDQPLPNEGEVASVSGGAKIGEAYAPATTGDKGIPKPSVARYLISDVLDTLAKRITGVFEFAKSGAIQIGEYIQGVSGDIKISPTGIVARNQAGEETLALDGSTGNAAFRGALRAGTIIGGDESVVIEEEEPGKGRIIVNDGVNDRILIGFQSGGF